jgi:pimeloyl-ACP methyl ester carboxylesterase
MGVLSDERVAPANGIELAYQEAGDQNGRPLLMIMGLATQMVAWDSDFCAMLAECGFRVVRFDNRDIGHSNWIGEAGVPSRFDMLSGRRATSAYTLADMAEDTFGLMDHLGIESAHLVGASMGGMIGQEMAIRRPQRVRSLVSMMSTTGNRWIGSPSFKAWGILLAKYPRTREQYLRRLDLPTTVLHGSADPLARPAAGRATAAAIPGARLRIFEGMGHDLPRELWPDFVDEIAANAERAGAALTGPRARVA